MVKKKQRFIATSGQKPPFEHAHRMGSTATGSMGMMSMNVTWFGSSAMLKASELVGGVNANMVGSVCPGMMVAAVSHGKLTEVGWTKTGLMAGPMVLDVVGVVNMVLSGSVLT